MGGDNLPGVIAAAVGLGLVSVMLIFRLGAAGAPTRAIAGLLAKVWGGAFAIGILLWEVSHSFQEARSGSPPREMTGMMKALETFGLSWEAAALAAYGVALGVLVWLLLEVRRASRAWPVQ